MIKNFILAALVGIAVAQREPTFEENTTQPDDGELVLNPEDPGTTDESGRDEKAGKCKPCKPGYEQDRKTCECNVLPMVASSCASRTATFDADLWECYVRAGSHC